MRPSANGAESGGQRRRALVHARMPAGLSAGPRSAPGLHTVRPRDGAGGRCLHRLSPRHVRPARKHDLRALRAGGIRRASRRHMHSVRLPHLVGLDGRGQREHLSALSGCTLRLCRRQHFGAELHVLRGRVGIHSSIARSWRHAAERVPGLRAGFVGCGARSPLRALRCRKGLAAGRGPGGGELQGVRSRGVPARARQPCMPQLPAGPHNSRHRHALSVRLQGMRGGQVLAPARVCGLPTRHGP